MIYALIAVVVLGVAGYFGWRWYTNRVFEDLIWTLVEAEIEGDVATADQVRAELKEYGIQNISVERMDEDGY